MGRFKSGNDLVAGHRRKSVQEFLEAVISFQLRGFLLSCRTPSRDTHTRATAFFFMSANCRGDSVGVEVVGPTDAFPDPMQFFDNGVAALHEVLPTGSSSGVQMIGGLRPSEREIASMVLRIVALARCLQFHVNRYAT